MLLSIVGPWLGGPQEVFGSRSVSKLVCLSVVETFRQKMRGKRGTYFTDLERKKASSHHCG